MKFKYKPFNTAISEAFPQKKKIYRPLIRITIQKGEKCVDVYGLVDSGADHCVFPSEIGDVIDINVKSGKKCFMEGIGGKRVEFYFHNIKIILGGHDIEVWAGFSDELKNPPLLGQSGFLKNSKWNLIIVKSKWKSFHIKI